MKRLCTLGCVIALAAVGACARESGGDPVIEANAGEAAPSSTATVASGPAAVPLPPGAPRVDPGPVEPLEVVTSRGPVRFQVEVADTVAETQQGLMWRGSMPADRGMVFDMARVQGGTRPQAFWMRNTYIPLDIIYLSPQGRVVNVGKGVPFSEETVPPEGSYQSVIELKAGTAERIGLKPGMKVELPKDLKPTSDPPPADPNPGGLPPSFPG